MSFTPSKSARSISMGMIVIGVVLFAVGFMGDHSHKHTESWASLFINGFFFFGISLGALFFYALQFATETSWSVLVRRVYEGIFSNLWLWFAIVALTLVAGAVGAHHVWGWMDPAVLNKQDPTHYDKLVEYKQPFLNKIFYFGRTFLLYGAIFIGGTFFFRKQSLKMDAMSGDELRKEHLYTYRRSALFLVFFAVLSSVMAWDWLMSIDVHWFSTLYGWYVFAGMWIGAMVTGVVLVLYLKSKGHLPQVNNSHIHDMGKWVFAVSFLWTYLYFSQFMLYWYANIPEEVTYFKARIDNHPGLMWGMFFINFAVPMIMLMSRDAKRNPRFLIGVGTVILIGHWLDLCQLVLPGALGEPSLDGHHGFQGIGLVEIGLFVAFLGLFINRVLSALTTAPLTVVSSPYLEESIHHQI